MSGLTVGSMFSGVEGMGLGVLDAFPGSRIAWHCEVDEHASAVLRRHFDAPNLGNVQHIDWSQVEPVDVLIGGPPCQAVSSAGRRLGSADPRWMWPQALRAMRELRPAWCLWENPTALLTGSDPDDEEEDDASVGDLGPGGLGGPAADPGWFGWILGEMAALGFDARWTCVRSSDVGAPHRRDRVFLAAADTRSAGTGGGSGAIPGPSDAGRRSDVDVHAAVDGGAGAPVALLPTPAAADGTGGRRATNLEWEGSTAYRPSGAKASVSLREAIDLLPTPKANGRTDAGVHGDGGLDLQTAVALLPTPNTVDASGVRSVATMAKARAGGGASQLKDAVALLPTPRASGRRSRDDNGDPYNNADGYDRESLVDAVQPDRWGKYATAVARWERLTGECAPGPRDGKGRLHADLPRWMMGLPPGWLDDIPRTAALKCAGNGCQPQSSSLAARLLVASLRGSGNG